MRLLNKLQALTFLIISVFAITASAQTERINEWDFDESGSDSGEFIEVFIADPQPADLSQYSIVEYETTGTSAGDEQGTHTLDGFTATAVAGGTLYHLLQSFENNDAVAFCGPSGVIQFFHTTNPVTANSGEGCAAGESSTALGSTGGYPSGGSVSYCAGTYVEVSNDTPGAINDCPCEVTFSDFTYTCLTNTSGNDNDGVTVSVDYIGVDADITSVTTTSSGSIGGDDPATVSDGTITLTGLMEGDNWDVVLNGGDCDGESISGTVNSAQCDPILMVVINEIENNSNGSDEEWVEICNNETSSVDISDWTIDFGDGPFTFPTSSSIGASSCIVISVADAGNQLFGWQNACPFVPDFDATSIGSNLNNSGGSETITLQNAGGITVDEVTFDPDDIMEDGTWELNNLTDDNQDGITNWTISDNCAGSPGDTNGVGCSGGCGGAILQTPGLFDITTDISSEADAETAGDDYHNAMTTSCDPGETAIPAYGEVSCNGDNLSGTITGLFDPAGNSVSATFQMVSVNPCDPANQADWITTDASIGSGTGCSSAGTMQSGSPKPTNLFTTHYTETPGTYDSGDERRNAVYICFGVDVVTFGVFVGDLESSSLGTPAEVYLLDASDNIIGYTPIDVSGTSTESACGSTQTNSGCGNELTHFISATTSGIRCVLIVVGDDDFCDNADSEHLSFGGVTTGVECQPAMPVELISFRGANKKNHNILSWITASEINNSHFEIQRSYDGFNFEKIGSINGHGTSFDNHEYEYIDDSFTSSLCYYRLKQYDYDGTFTLSNVIDLRRDNYIRMDLYGQNLMYDGFQDKSLLSIYNSTGQLLETVQISGNGTLNLSRYNSRLIFVSVKHNGDIITKKIFIP